MNTAITSASFLATVLPGADSFRTNNHLYVVREQSATATTGASRLFALLFGAQAGLAQQKEQASITQQNEPDYYSSYE